jgi:L-alanine-DL-glutamate epimerase-like enolase superfamily enzyme
MSPATGARVETVRTSVYEVATSTEHESDGTLTWSSTPVVVVQVGCDGLEGLGYTYCHPAAAGVIGRTLAGLVRGTDALMPGDAFARMQVAIRQLGHAGIATMAVSAVDIALWDLKARLLGVCLADALPRVRDRIEAYGSGGFTDLSDEQLRGQVADWARQGMARVKIKVGREPDRDPDRVRIAQEAVGPRVAGMVDANGAYSGAQAREWARRFAELGVGYLEEPVSSEDLAGLAEVRAGAPGGMEIAAGEYGWDLPYFRRMLQAGAVDVLQGDVTRCGGVTGLLRVDGLCRARNLPFSAHCAPAVSAHVCCAMHSARDIEYFHDHMRIEGLLFTGGPRREGRFLVPDRDLPGLGLTLDEGRADRFRLRGAGQP